MILIAFKTISLFFFKLLFATILLVAIFAVFLLQGFRTQMPECEKGPLVSISHCEKDHSTMTWQGSGWWYSLAKGQITKEFCTTILGNTDEILVPSGRRNMTEKLQKADCAYIFPGMNVCYAYQRMASNGNSRYLTALGIDGQCQKAHFFKGSKVNLVDGQPLFTRDFFKPYDNIPKERDDLPGLQGG